MRIGIVAGEPSGDRLAAALIEAVRRRAPQAQFYGMAGPRMVAAGCAQRFSIDQLSVVGFVEVLRQYPRLRRLRADVVRSFLDDPPDLFVLEPSAGGAPQAGAALDVRAVGQGPSGWRFAGREDSLVKIHGRWVNLVDLEERLAAKTPNLREGAAVLVPDSDGVDAVAYFFCASDAAAVASQLQERASALPPHQRPRWWHAIEALPRGPTGKLLRRRLQELHQQLG